jgi:hypothetical protein
MPTFAIDSATTEVSRERRGGRLRETRTLELEGPAPNGGRNRARFWFAPAVTRGPAVGYMVAADADGVSLFGWLPLEAYAAYHDIVAAGGPLQVHYETRDETSGYLRRLGIGRDNAALIASGSKQPGAEAARPAPREPAFAPPLRPQPSGSTAPRRASHQATSQQPSAQAAPAVQPARTSVGQ